MDEKQRTLLNALRVFMSNAWLQNAREIGAPRRDFDAVYDAYKAMADECLCNPGEAS